MEELKSRIRELETEQRLIQRELDGVTEAAQRAETQLRLTTTYLLCITDPEERLLIALSVQGGD